MFLNLHADMMKNMQMNSLYSLRSAASENVDRYKDGGGGGGGGVGGGGAEL